MTAITVPTDTRSFQRRLTAPFASILIVGVTLLAVSAIFPSNFSFYRAPWLLHPFEQEHLTIARNLAHGHGLTISDPTLDPAYGSEDKGYVNGRFVPRSVILPYLIYAAPFLVSDSAWLYVTPLFALAGAGACFALVRRRTCSMAAGAAAGIAFVLTGPVLFASTGIAYESVIALAFLLWGAYWAERYRSRPSTLTGLAAGTMLAAAANSRADYAPATALLAVLLLGWLLFQVVRNRRALYAGLIAGALAGALAAAVGVGLIFLTNYLVTGNPLHSAYGQDTWLGSTSSVTRSIFVFRPGDFLLQARLFLWELAPFTLPLLTIGVAAIIHARNLRWGDIVLLGLAGVLVAFHLERTGSHGSTIASLSASPPRYILPVYATATVVGFSALAAFLRNTLPSRSVAAVSILCLGAAIGVTGIREVYTNRTSFVRIQPSLERLRIANDFAQLHRDALFVGDTYTKGIIITERTLIPRLQQDKARVLQLVLDELQGGREVFVTDDLPNGLKQSTYSGYFEMFSDAGLALCPEVGGPLAIQRVLDSSTSWGERRQFAVPAASSTGVLIDGLEAGQPVYVIARGTFTNSQRGGVSTAASLQVDGEPFRGFGLGEGAYCSRFTPTTSALRLAVADSVYSDNRGALQVEVLSAR